MSPPRKQIFRQAALDRLSSPEQLDKLVPITDRLGWAALATVLVLLAGIVTWAVAGRIPQQVEGKGILVSSGGGIVDASRPGLPGQPAVGRRRRPGRSRTIGKALRRR